MEQRDRITFVGRLENEPVLASTTANRRLAVLCVTTSRLPLVPADPAATDTRMHRVVVWDETPESQTRGLRQGDRVLIHGIPAGPWKDADLDPFMPVEFIALSVTRLSPEASVAPSPTRAELRKEVFEALRDRRRSERRRAASS